MKNFNYTARDKAGATKHGSIKALDRNAALHELAAQGMVPLSVIEGAAVKGGNGQGVPLRYIAIAMAGLALVIAIITWSLMTPRKPAKALAKSSKTVEKVNTIRTSKSAVKTNAIAKPVVTNEPIATAIAANTTKETGAKTPTSTVMPYPGQTNRVIRFGGANTNRPSTGFTSRIDYAINQLISTPLGMPPPPMIMIPPGEDVKAALERSILVYDTDTPETIDKKEAVANGKQMVKDYMAKGGKPDDFLKFYHTQLLNAYDERRVSQKTAMDLMRAGDKDGAALYIEEQNKKFSEKGYVPISIPAIFQK